MKPSNKHGMQAGEAAENKVLNDQELMQVTGGTAGTSGSKDKCDADKKSECKKTPGCKWNQSYDHRIPSTCTVDA